MIWNLTKTEKDKATVTVYGPIKDFSSFFSSDGTSPDKVMRDLDELANAKEITLRINSGGGSAFAGMAIFELIRSHGARIVSRIDGVAASAASVIAMAGDRIIMGTGAMMMIHNPWTRVEGDAKKLRDTAEILDRVSESLVNVYQARTGKSREELKALVDKTTWLTAQEAVDMGFADEIDQKFSVSASIQGSQAVFNDQRFDLGIFAEAPQLPVKDLEPENKDNQATIPANAQEEPAAQQKTIEEPAPQGTKEDETVKDLAELQAKYPDVYQSALQAGADQERARIQAIDDIAQTVPMDMVNKAKYEEPITAQELAFKALKADASAGKTFTAAREDELNAANNVPSAAATSATPENDAAVMDKIAASANQKREGVKQ